MEFTGCATPASPGVSLTQDKIFLPASMHAYMFPDTGRTEQERLSGLGAVQPKLSQVEKPRLSASHVYDNGTVMLDVDSILPVASGRMDTPLGLTLHMKNEAPYPYGGPSAFYTEFNPAKATINAGLSLGGGDPVTPEYLVHPTWSNQVPVGGRRKVTTRFPWWSNIPEPLTLAP